MLESDGSEVKFDFIQKSNPWQQSPQRNTVRKKQRIRKNTEEKRVEEVEDEAEEDAKEDDVGFMNDIEEICGDDKEEDSYISVLNAALDQMNEGGEPYQQDDPNAAGATTERERAAALANAIRRDVKGAVTADGPPYSPNPSSHSLEQEERLTIAKDFNAQSSFPSPPAREEQPENARQPPLLLVKSPKHINPQPRQQLFSAENHGNVNKDADGEMTPPLPRGQQGVPIKASSKDSNNQSDDNKDKGWDKGCEENEDNTKNKEEEKKFELKNREDSDEDKTADNEEVKKNDGIYPTKDDARAEAERQPTPKKLKKGNVHVLGTQYKTVLQLSGSWRKMYVVGSAMYYPSNRFCAIDLSAGKGVVFRSGKEGVAITVSKRDYKKQLKWILIYYSQGEFKYCLESEVVQNNTIELDEKDVEAAEKALADMKECRMVDNIRIERHYNSKTHNAGAGDNGSGGDLTRSQRKRKKPTTLTYSYHVKGQDTEDENQGDSNIPPPPPTPLPRPSVKTYEYLCYKQIAGKTTMVRKSVQLKTIKNHLTSGYLKKEDWVLEESANRFTPIAEALPKLKYCWLKGECKTKQNEDPFVPPPVKQYTGVFNSSLPNRTETDIRVIQNITPARPLNPSRIKVHNPLLKGEKERKKTYDCIAYEWTRGREEPMESDYKNITEERVLGLILSGKLKKGDMILQNGWSSFKKIEDVFDMSLRHTKNQDDERNQNSTGPQRPRPPKKPKEAVHNTTNTSGDDREAKTTAPSRRGCVPFMIPEPDRHQSSGVFNYYNTVHKQHHCSSSTSMAPPSSHDFMRIRTENVENQGGRGSALLGWKKKYKEKLRRRFEKAHKLKLKDMEIDNLRGEANIICI